MQMLLMAAAWEKGGEKKQRQPKEKKSRERKINMQIYSFNQNLNML
jgi:hypothetical protein